MADQPANQNTSDEIDLGQLFQVIGNGFNKIGIGFLRVFLYLKKNAIILGVLIIAGVGIGYGLNKISRKKLKIEVIVKPNVESKHYLYNVVAEVENNIRAKDSTFFKKIGINNPDLKGLRISIEPIKDGEKESDGLEYLELLEKFQGKDEFLDLIKSELLKETVLSYRITFLFLDPQKGKMFAEKVMEYINSNKYFKELVSASNLNATERIKQNEIFIEQIDELIDVYSKSFRSKNNQIIDGRIVLDNNEKMNITGLFSLKNQLIQITERKRVELKEQKDAINVINFGKSQRVKTAVFARATTFMPLLFICLFFCISFLRFLNIRASNLLSND